MQEAYIETDRFRKLETWLVLTRVGGGWENQQKAVVCVRLFFEKGRVFLKRKRSLRKKRLPFNSRLSQPSYSYLSSYRSKRHSFLDAAGLASDVAVICSFASSIQLSPSVWYRDSC